MNIQWSPRYILLAFAALLPAMAQTNTPFVYGVVNSASYGSSIAQGSLFVVFGENLGPPNLLLAASLPLGMQLGGTIITVTSGSTVLTCPMIYSMAGQAAAIMPSNTPLGTAMVSVSYNQTMSPFGAGVTVVPTSAGLYSVSSSGVGPGSVTTPNGVPNTFGAPAKNGDIVIAWGTGLGPVPGPDASLPSAFPSFSGVEVFVGTQAAKVVYAGRSGCCVGEDQISFQVPDGVAGCYVPVAIRTGGSFSNFVSMAVSSDGGPCSDTVPTVSVTAMNQAAAGQSIKVALLSVGPIAILRGLGFDEKQYLADRLSKLLHAKVSREDVAKLLAAGQTHDRRAYNRALNHAMAKYAKAWKALDPAGKAAVSAAVNLSQEGAYAVFAQLTTPAAVAAAASGLFPSQGTCTVLTTLTISGQRTGAGLDAGPSLGLSGQAGAWTMSKTRLGQYQVMFGSSPTGPNVAPGTYNFTGIGGPDVPSFAVNLSVGPSLVWINKAGISTVDRSQPLTVSWAGGTTPGYVYIGGYVETKTGPFAAVVCAEDNAKGSFTIPSFILSALPAAANGGVIFIAPHPLSHPVSIPNVDLSYFIDGSSDSESVVYQ